MKTTKISVGIPGENLWKNLWKNKTTTKFMEEIIQEIQGDFGGNTWRYFLFLESVT